MRKYICKIANYRRNAPYYSVVLLINFSIDSRKYTTETDQNLENIHFVSILYHNDQTTLD